MCVWICTTGCFWLLDRYVSSDTPHKGDGCINRSMIHIFVSVRMRADGGNQIYVVESGNKNASNRTEDFLHIPRDGSCRSSFCVPFCHSDRNEVADLGGMDGRTQNPTRSIQHGSWMERMER